MGPRFAAEAFKNALPGKETSIRVSLFGSLAATGRGHLTDVAVTAPFLPLPVEILWKPETFLPRHPNGIRFEALDDEGHVLASRTVFSVGGGAIADVDGGADGRLDVYPFVSLQDVLAKCDQDGLSMWEIVLESENRHFLSFLEDVWSIMQKAIERGLETEGKLPGSLNLPRRAAAFHARATNLKVDSHFWQTTLVFSFALAVSEENASGGQIVTAPTCGAGGVLPSILYFFKLHSGFSDEKIYRAMATAGLIGNLVKRNASISGAEVGCQGEVGTACAMAAAAATQLLGGSVRQIEYAAEMGLEHHLGLTCDPIGGYVQIPCIERNAIAAVRALDCAAYALLSDGRHLVSFDDVVKTMWKTGQDLASGYRETAEEGLAKNVRLRRDT
jgi:L-serine dehydratase